MALQAADGRVPGHVPCHGLLCRGDLLVHRAADVLRSVAGVYVCVFVCFRYLRLSFFGFCEWGSAPSSGLLTAYCRIPGNPKLEPEKTSIKNFGLLNSFTFTCCRMDTLGTKVVIWLLNMSILFLQIVACLFMLFF